MDTRDVLVTINQALPVLQRLAEVLPEALNAEQHTSEAIAKKEEAEAAYRLAHAERGQIIEALENLKAQAKHLEDSYSNRSNELARKLEAEVDAAKDAAQKAIAEHQDAVAVAEADAAQRIARAELEAAEAEARVEVAKKALADLKGA